MLVYSNLKSEFLSDILSNRIGEKILNAYKSRLGKSPSPSEIMSWQNSLEKVGMVINEPTIPDNSGVAIEFNIPQTAKRIDFIITGKDEHKRKTAVIIELKQWTEAQVTTKDAIVKTFINHAQREVSHPSYQAWSYAALLEDFNESVRDTPIQLKPCAYLHNCESNQEISNTFYTKHLEKAPCFLKDDALKLKEFIKKHVRYGDNGDILYLINNGRIQPSKALADALASMLKGNNEFVLIDEQKVVFETARGLAQKAQSRKKQVLIVDGGPGTGKSVVAINLLVDFIHRAGMNARYVTKNAAPRAVYESKLTGTMTKTRISNLFTGSGTFTETKVNTFDALLVDEAHRLNEKSGMFQNKGENQIKEIIEAARLSVFFIDEDQRVTFKDIGEKEQIEAWAKRCGADVQELSLESQFRCNGADGYLAWLDHILGIRNTANTNLEGVDYEFKVVDSPGELKRLIEQKNKVNNKARMVAGYCWDWVSKADPEKMDIVITEQHFEAKWNLASDGSLWILKPESVSEIGCIHTCQGLELDYVGVIIGRDLMIHAGEVHTYPELRAKTDKSLQGYKALFKKNATEAKKKADLIIKNTYRTLMTRGQKGCFVYAVDVQTNRYLKTLTN